LIFSPKKLFERLPKYINANALIKIDKINVIIKPGIQSPKTSKKASTLFGLKKPETRSPKPKINPDKKADIFSDKDIIKLSSLN